MKAISRWGLAAVTLAVLPAGGCIVIGGGVWWGFPTVWTEAVTERVAISTDGLNAMAVRTHNGSVTLEGQDAAQEAYVIVTKKAGASTAPGAAEAMAALETFVEPAGDGTLNIGYRWSVPKKGGWTQQVSFEVHAPAHVAIDAESHNGAIRVANVTGDVRVETHNGGVTVSSREGRLQAETHNGRIAATYIGESVLLETHNGSVTADLSGCASVAGSITTHNGGVEIVVGDAMSARLVASTHNGGIRCAVPLSEMESSRRKLEGVLGGGAGRLAVTTHNGSVRVKTAG